MQELTLAFLRTKTALMKGRRRQQTEPGLPLVGTRVNRRQHLLDLVLVANSRGKTEQMIIEHKVDLRNRKTTSNQQYPRGRGD